MRVAHILLLFLWLLPVVYAEEMHHHEHHHGMQAMHPAPPLPNANYEQRDPNAYAEGYALTDLPFHAAHSDDYRASWMVDRLESITTATSTAMTYDLQAWYGTTYNRALIRTEGDLRDGNSQNVRSELLWSHAMTPFWDSHLGVRYDSGSKLNRSWLALGVQGIAPYWLYVEATAYLNEQGRTAFRLEFEYDLLLTQRFILQPRIETNVYGKNDAAHAIGDGLSALEAGVRMRYEVSREFAPYVGIDWDSFWGKTASYVKQNSTNTQTISFVAGIHFWF
jgi:copper resistance protein B